MVNNNNNNLNSTPKENGRRLVLPLLNQESRVLDPKKSQNIAILLRALNVTIEEVCEALSEGNCSILCKLAWAPCFKIAGPSFVMQVIPDFKFLLANYGYLNIELNLCLPTV